MTAADLPGYDEHGAPSPEQLAAAKDLLDAVKHGEIDGTSRVSFTVVLDAAAFDILDSQRAIGMRALLRRAIDDGGDVRCAAVTLAEVCRGVVRTRRVEAALARRRGGQRVRIVPTDERFAKLVGAILNDTGSGSEHLAADAAAQAAAAHARQDRRGSAQATTRAHRLADTCEGARTPALITLAAPLPLTTREREIVTLAANGLSNRQIAQRLIVSVRTVENHLYRACTKLGTSDRAELAALLHGH